MIARRSSLLRDRAGSVTIELAMLAPILAVMLIGLIDMSTAHSDKLRLEQVAQRTVEKVMQNGFTTAQEADLEAEAEAASGTGSDADLIFWLECNGVKQTGSSAYVNGCADGEEYARYIQLDIQKNYTPLIMARFTGSNPDGTITIHGVAGIRIQ